MPGYSVRYGKRGPVNRTNRKANHMFDQNGLVTVESSPTPQTPFDTEAAQNRMKGIEPTEKSFAQLVEDALREMSVAAAIIVDPVGRKVLVMSGADLASQGLSTVIPHTVASVLQPETGQSGRSLTWEAGTDTGAGVPNKAALIAPTDAVKPARSASSLVGAVLAALGAIDPAVAEADQPLLVVDQTEGKLHLIKPTNRATSLTNIRNRIVNAGYGVELSLTEPAGGSEAEPLIFEGGATS